MEEFLNNERLVGALVAIAALFGIIYIVMPIVFKKEEKKRAQRRFEKEVGKTHD